MKEESCEWGSDWCNSKGITFLMKNVEEKNQESPKEAENLANYSATEGECTHMIFLTVFFTKGIFHK